MAGAQKNQPTVSGSGPEGQQFVLMGRFGAPHGVRGDLKLSSFAQDPSALARYDGLRLGDGREVRLTHLRLIKNNLCVVHVQGIDSRTAAQVLTHQELLLPRAALPATAQDEFYLTDLIGLKAIGPDGEVIGMVSDVVNYGAGDILEIKPVEGEVFLLAFTRAHVPAVDCAGGTISIILPDEIDGEPERGTL
jgi:16S rRNA processing protein RimM